MAEASTNANCCPSVETFPKVPAPTTECCRTRPAAKGSTLMNNGDKHGLSQSERIRLARKTCENLNIIK